MRPVRHARLARPVHQRLKPALPSVLAPDGMIPTRKQLLEAIDAASLPDASLTYALQRLAGFIARHTSFRDLGRALGAAYPANKPLPQSIERVALPSPPKRDTLLSGQDCRRIVTCLREHDLLELAELVLFDAQRLAFGRQHPNRRVPYQLTGMLHELIRSTDPDRPRSDQFCPIDRLSPEHGANSSGTN